MKTRNHNSWTTRASGLETGTSVLVFFKERIQQREGSETTKAFIKKKKKGMCGKIQEWESHELWGWLKLFVWGQFSGFPLANLASSCLVSISACNAGDLCLIPGLRRYSGEENGYPLHVLAWRIPWTEGKPWGCREADTTEQLTLGLT